MGINKFAATAAIITTAAVGYGAPSVASAATMNDSGNQAISTVMSAFSASHNTEGMKELQAAPKSVQLKVAEALTSHKDISSMVTYGTPTVTSSHSRKIHPGLASPAATTYSVTSQFSVPAKVLGVTIATYHQVYDYTTGSGRVLSDRNCRGYWNGFTGINTFDYSVDHYVSGGQGYCIVYDQVSLVYKGLGATYEKKGYLQVNGPGIVDWYLVND